MAEIGLFASVLAVASFGTQLATNLYKFSDDIRQAPRQIRKFARKVTSLSDALHQTRKTLRSERGNYNQEAEVAIKVVIKSCKRDFREIDGALQFKRFRRISWLFKKSKAEELLRSLETQASTLQIMMNGITLSAVLSASKQTKRRSDQQEEEIQNLVATMENLARINQDLTSHLKAAEAKSVPDSQAGVSAYTPIPGPLYHDDALSDDYSTRRDAHDQPGYERASNDAGLGMSLAEGSLSFVVGDPMSATRDETKTEAQTSNAILQVIPWSSTMTANHRMQAAASNREDFAEARGATEAGATATGMNPADAIQFVLTTYTPTSKETLRPYLTAFSARRGLSPKRDGREAYYNDGGPFQHHHSPAEMNKDSLSSSDEDSDDESSEDLWSIPRRRCAVSTEDKAHTSKANLAQAGRIFMSALRKSKGGFIWMRGNSEQVSCYCGKKPFYIFQLRESLNSIQQDDFTRIGKSWVRKEVLQLHQYRFCELDGFYHIYQPLTYEVLKELAMLSAGALVKQMIQHSQHMYEGSASYPFTDSDSHDMFRNPNTMPAPPQRPPPMPRPMPRSRYNYNPFAPHVYPDDNFHHAPYNGANYFEREMAQGARDHERSFFSEDYTHPLHRPGYYRHPTRQHREYDNEPPIARRYQTPPPPPVQTGQIVRLPDGLREDVPLRTEAASNKQKPREPPASPSPPPPPAVEPTSDEETGFVSNLGNISSKAEAKTKTVPRSHSPTLRKHDSKPATGWKTESEESDGYESNAENSS